MANERMHEILEHFIRQLEHLKPMLRLSGELQQRYNSALRELSEIVVAAQAVAQHEQVPAAIITEKPVFSPEFVKEVDLLANEEPAFERGKGCNSPRLAAFIKACKDIFPKMALEAVDNNKQLDAAVIIGSIELILFEKWTKKTKQYTTMQSGGEGYCINIDRINRALIGYHTTYKILDDGPLKVIAAKSASEVVGLPPDNAFQYAVEKAEQALRYIREYYRVADVFYLFTPHISNLLEYTAPKMQNSSASEKMGFSMLANALAHYYFAVAGKA